MKLTLFCFADGHGDYTAYADLKVDLKVDPAAVMNNEMKYQWRKVCIVEQVQRALTQHLKLTIPVPCYFRDD